MGFWNAPLIWKRFKMYARFDGVWECNIIILMGFWNIYFLVFRGFWNVSLFWLGLGIYPCFDEVWECTLLLMGFGNVSLLWYSLGMYPYYFDFLGFWKELILKGFRNLFLIWWGLWIYPNYFKRVGMHPCFNRVLNVSLFWEVFEMFPYFNGV